MVFRYDPPVLVVALTWHQSPAPFCDSLYQHLIQGYYASADDVCIWGWWTGQIAEPHS